MDSINYSVQRMPSEEMPEPFVSSESAVTEVASPPVMTAPTLSPVMTVPPSVSVEKPVEASVAKKQYYGFSRPTGFPGTEGSEEAGMSTMQKVGLVALDAILLGSLFRG